MVRILIADDHVVVRQGLKQILAYRCHAVDIDIDGDQCYPPHKHPKKLGLN
ncbi:MAG: hypothetical protein ABL903_17555 [Methylococcales bacterium]